MENGNKKLLWLIAIVNVLTLVLLIGFIAMSWDVITVEKAPQPEIKQQTPTATPQQTPQVQQQIPSQQQSPTGGQIQPPANRTIQGKCGDGTCDELEKANPNLCPKDCK